MTGLFGYSPLTPEQLLASVAAGEPLAVRPGDWTVVSEGGPGKPIRMAASMIAATPCLFARDTNGRVHLGGNVFDVAHSAGLAWEWNKRAIRCLALFGHTVGRDTLHPRVFRAPNDAVMEFDREGATERSLGSWAPVRSEQLSVHEALAVLRRVFERDVAGAPVLLSLSAGYDSRLLLALCLAAGVRPRCVTMGPEGATDVEVAQVICR
jgi:asparagine synthetase B (glutamine-hydrolysing)